MPSRCVRCDADRDRVPGAGKLQRDFHPDSNSSEKKARPEAAPEMHSVSWRVPTHLATVAVNVLRRVTGREGEGGKLTGSLRGTREQVCGGGGGGGRIKDKPAPVVCPPFLSRLVATAAGSLASVFVSSRPRQFCWVEGLLPSPPSHARPATANTQMDKA